MDYARLWLSVILTYAVMLYILAILLWMPDASDTFASRFFFH